MKAGDTFQLVDVADQHLWIVISDPNIDAECVLFVNITSYDKYVDQTIILNSGDHPFIQHRSCVEYGRARIARNYDLDQLASQSRLKIMQPIGTTILQRLREGASLSNRIKIEHLEILRNQGLVD